VDVRQSLGAAMFLMLISLVVVTATRVFRRNSIDGPVRVGADRPAIGLAAATAMGLLVWFGAQIAYAAAYMAAHPGTKFAPENLSARDMAMLSVVPAAIGLVAVVIADAVGKFSRPIGYAPSRLPVGIALGVVAVLAVLPLVYASSILLELYYRWRAIEHPSEHEMLGAMRDAPADVRLLLVIGACVAAPVFEEMLFRGHVQTLLVRLFTPKAPRAFPAVSGFPVAGVPDPAIQPMSSDPTQPVGSIQRLEDPPSPVPARPPPALLWAAVLITSIIFAAIHPAWMRPVIFVLSVGIGYAYERTGNLWVAIAVHATFNTVSTIVFLNIM
jgi:membrane protease YdiL (CAAX protease family)